MLREVKIGKDDGGHWYIVPNEEFKEFYNMLNEGEDDEWEAFEKKFGKYRTGGDLNNVQLWAEI